MWHGQATSLIVRTRKAKDDEPRHKPDYAQTKSLKVRLLRVDLLFKSYFSLGWMKDAYLWRGSQLRLLRISITRLSDTNWRSSRIMQGIIKEDLNKASLSFTLLRTYCTYVYEVKNLFGRSFIRQNLGRSFWGSVPFVGRRNWQKLQGLTTVPPDLIRNKKGERRKTCCERGVVWKEQSKDLDSLRWFSFARKKNLPFAFLLLSVWKIYLITGEASFLLAWGCSSLPACSTGAL